ncbi:MAG: hypothetical protein ABI781_21390, partial [Burkholderiales bacterium]
LSADEVYAATAYLLSLADVVPADFTLSDRNIADMQKRLPNRDGKVWGRDLWEVAGKGDVKNTACMANCPVDGKVTSSFPDAEWGSNGNLADQNRLVGPVRGVGKRAVPQRRRRRLGRDADARPIAARGRRA